MKSSSLGSVTLLLERLKAGNDDAAGPLWNRYFGQLAALARTRLKNGSPEADGEDVALSALNTVFMGARDSRYPRLNSRTELWSLLVTITIRKAANESKRQYAQKRSRSAEDHEIDFVAIPSDTPSPESTVEVSEELERLLAKLNDTLLRRIAILRMEGHTVEEIASQLQRSERTIARKLSRIRQEWSEDFL